MSRQRQIALACLLALCLPPLLVSAALGDQRPRKSVLYLNSYHHGYRWSDSIHDGVRATLDQGPYKIDLQVEYLDAKRYNTREVSAGLLEVYRKKYQGERFDVIILSDDDALNFALEARPQLFPGTPIVFCGINDLGEKALARGNLTGVIEAFDLLGTIDVALRLHPQKKRMVVVGDDSTAGLAIRKQIEDLEPHYRHRLQVEYWIQIALIEAEQRLEQLPNDTFCFFIPYYQSINNHIYTAEEVMRALSRRSSVPFYTSWEFLLGHGAVGGSMISGMKHGRIAAEMALKILDGVPAEAIPVMREPSGSYLFDYEVMRQLHIPERLLPKGATLINAPKAFYELPKELFWTIITSTLLLFISSIALVVTMIGRRRVERRIKDQLSFQETLMDTNPQLVSWKDRNFRYLGANRTFSTFFGLSDPSELIAKTTREVVGDQDYAQWSQQADLEVINNRQAFRKVRRQLTDYQGNVAWIEVNKVPVRDQAGKIVGILSTAENITRELDLEKQLLQSQKMEAIGTLAGGIAHDFNNILTSIINSTELAIGDVDPQSQTAKDLERVLKAARRGGRVVKQILAFSKPSQEGFRPINLTSVVSEVVGLLEISLPGNVEVRSHISPHIGAVLADPTQIYQAVMNLCTNAFQALREEGGIMHIRLEDKTLDGEEAGTLNLEAGDYIQLTVVDNGPGIRPDILDKIFDPFFSTKDKSEGTGLGLAVVHGIVKAHQGGFRVDSIPGRETAFRLFFPRSGEEGEGVEERRPFIASRGGTILFVEDDEDQLHTTPRILANVGYAVTALALPREALALLEREPERFDLLITDYDMPAINGVELIRRIHAVNPRLPSILISGREDALKAAENMPSIRRVFIKPYDTIDLTLTINSILDEA